MCADPKSILNEMWRLFSSGTSLEDEEKWAVVANAIGSSDPEIFADLHSSSFCYEEFLKHVFADEQGITVEVRPSKRPVRYAKKFSSQTPGHAKFRKDGSFKCVSDLWGARILTKDVTAGNLKRLAHLLVDATLAAGGMAFTMDFGPSICERVYLMFQGAPIAEISIGHPFAAHVFKCDSTLRDVKDGIVSADYQQEYQVDYWANRVWKTVQASLLDGKPEEAQTCLETNGITWPGTF